MPMKLAMALEALYPTPPLAAKIKKFLDRQAPDALFTGAEIRQKVRCGVTTTTRAKPYLEGYFLPGTGGSKPVLWGNPRAIQSLRKQLEGR